MKAQNIKSQISLSAKQKEKLRKNQCLVFTDLDGTMLGHDDYDLGLVPELLKKLKALGWPVILNTSKTWAEVQVLQYKLGYFNPCVVENGGGVHCGETSKWKPKVDMFSTISREKINLILDQINSDFKFERMRDWCDDQIVQHTGLPVTTAALANQRFYSEPLLWQDTESNLVHFRAEVEKTGLKLVRGGRFCHLMGNQDKSTAMKQLVNAYQHDFGVKPLVIALGDNQNDKKMLEKADVACILSLPEKAPLILQYQSNVIYPSQVAPQGWCDGIEYIVSLKE